MAPAATKRPSPDKMTFLEHLDELRQRLMVSLLALAAGFVICFSVSQRIFDFLMEPLRTALPPGGKLIATTVPELFMLHLKMSFFVGIFLASPVLVGQLWRFISPGLYEHEKKFAVPFVVFGTVFFLLGAAFAHYVVFPYAANFFTTFGGGGVEILLTVSEVFSFYSKFILGMGLVFEIPTVVFVLSRIGLISAGFLVRQIKFAVLLIFIVAAIITPTPDVVTQCLMAFPMIGLYVFSIGVAWFVGREREVPEKAEKRASNPEP
jgi:sec-independent protein translocase protein TatC